MSEAGDSEVDRLLARAAGGTRVAREAMKHALVDLRTPDRFRLEERQRSLAANILDRLLASLSDDIQQLAGLSRLEIGGSVVPKRYQRLLRVALERSNEHLLMSLVRGEEVPFQPDASPVLDIVADYPDARLSERTQEYVVTESRRYDRFGEPLLPLEELPARIAASAAWLVAASIRKAQLRTAAAGEAMLDGAIQAAVQRTLGERNSRTSIHWRAARLVARLARVGEIDDDFLSETFRSAQLPLFAAALAHRAEVPAALVRRLLTFRDSAALAVMMRALGIGEAAAGAVLTALTAHDLPQASSPSLLYARIEPDAARAQIHRWRLDAGYARAIAALDEEASA